MWNENTGVRSSLEESMVRWTFTVDPTPKPHHHPLWWKNNPHCWLCLFIVYNHSIISSPIKTKGLSSQTNRHTHTHLIRACLTAPSQCTMEPCWHGPAWGMGRSEVYDCADVNDIIQILNQAARFQPSGSSLLAVSLENLTWTPAAEQSNCCRQEWSGLPRLKTTDSWPQTDSQNKSDLSVCPSTHPSVYSVF